MYKSIITVLIKDIELKNNIKSFFKKSNDKVFYFEEEKDFYDCISKETISLILLDNYYLKVCHKLKQDNKLRKIPVLVILNSTEEIEFALHSSSDEFIIKPVNVLELEARIKVLLKVRNYQILLEYDAIHWKEKEHQQTSQIEYLKKYTEIIVNNIPVNLLVVNDKEKILFVNPLFAKLKNSNISNIVNKYINDVFNGDTIENKIRKHLSVEYKQDYFIEINDVKNLFYEYPENIYDINLYFFKELNEKRFLFLINDVTEKNILKYRNNLIKDFIAHLQGTLDLEKIIYIVLTCVTAGIALSFSRAFLLLIDEKTHILKGVLGVGPKDQADANQIWSSISAEPKGLFDFVNDYEVNIQQIKEKHKDLLNNLQFYKEDYENYLSEIFVNKKTLLVNNSQNNNELNQKMLKLLGTSEFILAPIINNNKPIGLIIADNKFSYRPINEENIVLLNMFASQVGQSIEIANAHQNLKNKITELKSIQNKLIESQQKLLETEKLATLGRVSTYIAHEIRNPLVTIGGLASLLGKNIKKQKYEQAINKSNAIVTEINLLENILSGIMDYSRYSKIEKKKININELLDKILFLLNNMFEQKNITIIKHFFEADYYCNCDDKKIRQVFINLFKNSFEAINIDGKIEVTTSKQDNNILITVEDDGIGIESDVLEKIFEPFFTTKNTGTGIGMAIVYNTIKSHKGSINISSQVNKGTKVEILLPID